jgi:Replication-relaxation
LALEKERLLEQLWIPHAKPKNRKGGSSVVYILGQRGKALLRSEGFGDQIKRFEFGHETTISKHRWHSLWVNDIVVSAFRFIKETPGIEMPDASNDFDFKRIRKQFEGVVQWGDGTKHDALPDGLIAFKFENNGDEKQFLIELETGSQAPAAIKEKVRNLALFIKDGGYQRTFGTQLFNGFLFFTTGTYGKYASADDHRKAVLVAIAEQLREMGLSGGKGNYDYRPLFRVTAEPLESPHLFDRPVWFYPDEYQPYRLFVDKF